MIVLDVLVYLILILLHLVFLYIPSSTALCFFCVSTCVHCNSSLILVFALRSPSQYSTFACRFSASEQYDRKRFAHILILRSFLSATATPSPSAADSATAAAITATASTQLQSVRPWRVPILHTTSAVVKRNRRRHCQPLTSAIVSANPSKPQPPVTAAAATTTASALQSTTALLPSVTRPPSECW